MGSRGPPGALFFPGERDYGPPIDLWGAGCIMAEMWTRSPIMQGNTEQHQLALISQLCGSITPEVRGQAAWAPGPWQGRSGEWNRRKTPLWRGGWWRDRTCSLEPHRLSLLCGHFCGLGQGTWTSHLRVEFLFCGTTTCVNCGTCFPSEFCAGAWHLGCQVCGHCCFHLGGAKFILQGWSGSIWTDSF